jgi:hypothetical protein
MPKVIFTISYSVKPEQRDDYLSVVTQIKNRLSAGGKDYSVFETKGKGNQFTEMFVMSSLEEFDSMDEDQDEATESLISKLEEYIVEGSKKYTTLIEAEL